MQYFQNSEKYKTETKNLVLQFSSRPEKQQDSSIIPQFEPNINEIKLIISPVIYPFPLQLITLDLDASYDPELPSD